VSLVITENISSIELKSAEGLFSELFLYLEFNNEMLRKN